MRKTYLLLKDGREVIVRTSADVPRDSNFLGEIASYDKRMIDAKYINKATMTFDAAAWQADVDAKAAAENQEEQERKDKRKGKKDLKQKWKTLKDSATMDPELKAFLRELMKYVG
jgi:hypothetical protein